MRSAFGRSLAALALASAGASAFAQVTFVSQLPAASGGTLRWSKLWIDTSGQGNNLDGDAICYEDFTLAAQSQINHLEWWGTGASDQGFRIEFWKQDPGTTAYQPLGVFRESGALPEAAFNTTGYTSGADGSGTTHFSLDLASPVTLAANDASNPRWFVAIVGLTTAPYAEWNWAQGLGGSNRTFQFIRGGSPAGGDWFTALPEGRALVLSGAPVPEPAAIAALGIGVLALAKRRRSR